MDSTKAVLLVPDREEWERQFGRYAKTRKRVGACIGLALGGPLLAGSLYLTGLLYPLLRGDIAAGHPSYDAYKAASATALLIVVAALVLYAGSSIIFGRWLRKTHVLLGFNPDGSFPEVRGALSRDSTNA
ncbi:hypothetical protein [Arthrobacter sp. D3-16]